MKKILLVSSILIAFSAKGQAHLGSTEYEIRNLHTDNKWTVGYTDGGIKYISSDMVYGTFTYYFNKETGISYLNIQIPFNQATMNGQVEAYNKKYVITSDTSWTAYLDDGGIIYIKLLYNEKNKVRYFAYSATK